MPYAKLNLGTMASTTPTLAQILETAHRHAHYFLTPASQPCATLPTGQVVPLHSFDFHLWLSAALHQQGHIFAYPSLIGKAMRRLDRHAHATLHFRPIHLRSAQTKPNHYTLDLPNQSIEINGKHWRVGENSTLNFRRPFTNLPLPQPRITSAKLDWYLEQSFNISDSDAQALKNWLILALLPTSTPPPFLIIRGKARNEAVTIIRNLLDPARNPILAVPFTPQGLGDLAIRNRILAFSIFGQLSKGRVEILKRLRTGTPVPLWERSKFGGKIEATIQRPIIIASEEDVAFNADKLILEINETADTFPDEFLGALLTAAVLAIREFTRPPAYEGAPPPKVFQAPQSQGLQVPAPYT